MSADVETTRHETDSTAAGVLTPARPPVGTGAAPLFGQLVALVLVAVGVVGIEEAVSRSGLTSGPSWISRALDRLDAQSVPDWFLPVGVLVALLGLALLPVVFKRRPRKTLRLRAATGVSLKTKDLARLARARMDGLDGVTSTRVEAGRRRLRVRATTIAAAEDNSALEAEVEQRLRPCLDQLDSPPRLKVAIKNEDLT